MAKKVKIHSPVPGYSGSGPGDTQFENGVLETDDPAVIAYCQGAGYKVSGKVLNETSPTPDVDPRDMPDGEPVGTRLRDAAVDPRPEDFLPPVNAGEANPHGPLVVAPGLHAVPPAPIVPGVVSHDADEQAAKETQVAKAVLVDGELATVVASDEGPGGPLGLSDPGSVEAGIEGAAENRREEGKAGAATKRAQAATRASANRRGSKRR